MAVIEIQHEGTEKSGPGIERIEVRVWGLAGKDNQLFFGGGGGMNIQATGNPFIEIIHSMQGFPLFYTRNFLHAWMPKDGYLPGLEKFERGEIASFGFGDLYPSTEIVMKRESYPSGEETHHNYILEIKADIGTIFCDTGPSQNHYQIKLEALYPEDAIRFMRQLVDELNAASAGKHPDPAQFPIGSSDWHFVRQLNQRAYNSLAGSYREKYFENPLITREFDLWMEKLPANGHILDAGCGTGNPVIARLLEHRFQVTGTDISPLMLELAREQFPGVTFWEKAITEVDSENIFDGACSFSSMLYLDRIDLLNAIHRLHRALKPGGLLFLYAFDLHPGWRGAPYDTQINQWMWSWTYSDEEAADALEEHGRFKVLQMVQVMTDDEKQEQIEGWKKSVMKQHEKAIEMFSQIEGHKLPDPPKLDKPPDNLPYNYVIIAQKTGG